MKNQYIPTIKKQVTEIDVGENIAFVHPFIRPNNYKGAAKEILNHPVRMSLPNGEKTSYLLKAVYCGPEDFQKEPEAVELRDEIMKQKYLWIFQRNLWVPEEYESSHGVFVVYDEKGVGISKELDIGELEKALKGGRRLENGVRFSEDGKVSFAPRKSYKDGEMTAEEFANDGFIIASCEENGARNLAEVSQSKYFPIKEPRSWIVNTDNKPIQTISALGDRVWYGYGLDFGGSYRVVGRYGCASGVVVV